MLRLLYMYIGDIAGKPAYIAVKPHIAINSSTQSTTPITMSDILPNLLPLIVMPLQ